MGGALRSALLVAMALSFGCSGGQEGAESQVDSDELEELELEELERLAALGYLETRPIAPQDRAKVGAVVTAGRSASAGYQLLTERKTIRLIDMAGDTVRIATAGDLRADVFSEAEYLPNGRLLVIKTDESIVWLDREWRPVREVKLPAHHDLSVHGGRIHTLTRRLERVSRPGGELPMLVDSISILSEDGAIEREISLDDVLGHLVPERRLQAIRDWVEKNGDPLDRPEEAMRHVDGRDGLSGTPLNAYHANFVQVADRDVPGVCRAGDLLVSIRAMNLVAFIRPEESRVVWSWGRGHLEWQHNPMLLPDGNLLIFDNGVRRRWSRVLELDPRRSEIVWQYHGEPKRDFYSSCCGSAEKLANGNVVITDAERGRVFEVTPDREVVWDYWSAPSDAARTKRISVLRSHRVPAALVLAPDSGEPVDRGGQ